jgi:hypothetical protein
LAGRSESANVPIPHPWEFSQYEEARFETISAPGAVLDNAKSPNQSVSKPSRVTTIVAQADTNTATVTTTMYVRTESGTIATLAFPAGWTFDWQGGIAYTLLPGQNVWVDFDVGGGGAGASNISIQIYGAVLP